MLAERVNNLSPSPTMVIDAKAKALAQKGEKVINLGVGEPDFHTPDNIKLAAKSAIDNNFTKYPPASGHADVKKAIVEKLKRENNLKYSEKEVIVSAGAKHSLFNIFFALLNEGDEAIIPAPYWVSYSEQVKLAGGIPVITEPSIKITAELIASKLSQKTKMIIINSPNNPSGAVISSQELKKIADLAVKNNLYTVSDEVYEKFIYDGNEHVSIASLNDEIKKLTIVVNAVSKTYSMTGWRLGYCAGDEKIIKAIEKIQSQTTSGICTISQKAATEALNGSQYPVEQMRKEFQRRRDFIITGLNKIKGIKCELSGGAFYAFPDITATGLSSEEFCNRLLDEYKVATVPGAAFGMEGRIRICFAASIEEIKEGVERLEKFCQNLQ